MTPKVALRIDSTMEDVLDVLVEHQNATTGFLVDETESTRPTITKRLDRLHAAGCIEYLHEPTALWTLIEDPRDDE